MEDQILTPHFRLSEFSRSATVDSLGIDNSVPKELIPSLKNLCEHVLEPLREHFGIPVVISSGYRCPALNRTVGGVSNSQHLKGEAADIILPPSTLNIKRLVPLDNGQHLLRPAHLGEERLVALDSR